MKKILLSMLALCLALIMLYGCTPASPETLPADSIPLDELMDKILSGVELPATGSIEIDDDNYQAYLFTEPPAEYEALASEAMISAIAHSVVLLRVPDNADELAQSIRENADPAKWICVLAEKTVVTQHGNTVLLVMSTAEAADRITANFDSLYE